MKTLPSSDTRITDMHASALSLAMHEKHVSCREVMSATLDRIAELNPHCNAIVSLQDGDLLLAQADERDSQLARGISMGWMHGIPQAIKDLSATAGIVTTQGSPLLRNFVPATDSLMVQRMNNAGCIVVGKTNTLPYIERAPHMVDSIHSTDTIDGHGYPICFKTRPGQLRPGALSLADAKDLFITQARAMGGHQKEAVVTEGQQGSSWRMVSDEGPALKGTDLAPFPLGYMSAGLQADLLHRIAQLASTQGIDLQGLACNLENDYMFEGSFFKGTGKGLAYRPRFQVQMNSQAPPNQVLRLVQQAVAASPLLASWASPLHNTFALYANGRNVTLRDLAPSPIMADDPFKTWSQAPAPLEGTDVLDDIVSKTQPVEVKNPTQPSGWEAGRVDIPIHGRCESANGIGRSVTWANRLGGSAFAIQSDDRSSGDQAPSALAHAYAGIAFCFMTQLLRYVEHHHMKVRALRLVQLSPCHIASGVAQALPLDTHVFVHSEESDEVMERLVQMSARTCYLHAALSGALPPEVALILNGQRYA